MTEVTQKQLLPGVSLTAVHTTKFKSAYLGVQLLTPLAEETAALNALVPMVLRRGTARCPGMEQLSAALDDLYGGAVEPMVRKKGAVQCVGFVGSFLDDAYAPGGEPILERATALLGELLLRPATEQGAFRPAYVEGERANLADRIRAQVNDKRQYAMLRLNQLMFQGEPCGVDRLGDEAHAAAITGEALWAQYQKLLATARVQLYYCGSAGPERAEAAFRAALDGLDRTGDAQDAPRPAPAGEAPEEPRRHEEAMDVTQGKLALGFRAGVDAASPGYPAAALMNALFGGTTTSRLFLNVRERLSLCYYASSQMEKFMGAVLVSSGVEFHKRREAEDEILAQLENIRAGRFEPWELEAARRSLVSAYTTLMDAQARLEDFWLGQAVLAGDAPEALVEKLERVTAGEVSAAARNVRLDTIYFLKGKEDQSSG